jgi:hypothetical protein
MEEERLRMFGNRALRRILTYEGRSNKRLEKIA